jgi:hypothetical protein
MIIGYGSNRTLSSIVNTTGQADELDAEHLNATAVRAVNREAFAIVLQGFLVLSVHRPVFEDAHPLRVDVEPEGVAHGKVSEECDADHMPTTMDLNI